MLPILVLSSMFLVGILLFTLLIVFHIKAWCIKRDEKISQQINCLNEKLTDISELTKKQIPELIKNINKLL